MKKMIKENIIKTKSLLSKLPNMNELYHQGDRKQVQKYLSPTSPNSIIHRMKAANALSDTRFAYASHRSVELLAFINEDYQLRIEVEHMKLKRLNYPIDLPCTITVSYHPKVTDGRLILLGYSDVFGDGDEGFLWNVERRIWTDMIMTNIERFIDVADQKRKIIHDAVRDGYKNEINKEIERRNTEEERKKLRQKEDDLVNKVEAQGGKLFNI